MLVIKKASCSDKPELEGKEVPQGCLELSQPGVLGCRKVVIICFSVVDPEYVKEDPKRNNLEHAYVSLVTPITN